MTYLKVIHISPAYINQLHNLKSKLYGCKASSHFNQKCLRNNLIPNFARTTVKRTSPASKYTQNIASILRLREENVFLYTKKNKP